MSNLGSEDRSIKGQIPNGSVGMVERRLSETSFLRKVLRKELGEDIKNHNQVIITAVHAVLLETGFIGFDPDSRTPLDRFHLSNDRSTPLSFYYTLPAILGKDYVVLKFQTIGHFVNVFASIANNIGSESHRLFLDAQKFASLMDDTKEFCKIVKDEIASPLLIDVCAKSGLPLPPCLMSLPTELKRKILELVPGVDLGRVACVCKELKKLSHEEELWKMKMGEKFGKYRVDNKNGSQLPWSTKYTVLWTANLGRANKLQTAFLVGTQHPLRHFHYYHSFYLQPTNQYEYGRPYCSLRYAGQFLTF
ncbi:hypothetical protein UlMin_022478 [Ulmus minor]